MTKEERMFHQIENEATFRALSDQEKEVITDKTLWSGEICDALDLDKKFNKQKIRLIRQKYGYEN